MRLMADGVAVELYCAAGQHHGMAEDLRTAGMLHRSTKTRSSRHQLMRHS
jgi:hypothetical protein